jgi:anti-anti-sigma factor
MGLRLDSWTRDDAVVVAPRGLLDLTTSHKLRDLLVKVATDHPRAVVVDLAALDIDSSSSIALFATVHTRLAEWPGVPLLLVAGAGRARELLSRYRTGRYIPVHETIDAAVAAIDEAPPRRVTRIRLPNALTSPRIAREFARSTCADWEVEQLSDDATLLVGELMSNAVIHTSADPRVRLELRRRVFSIAVYDDEPGEVSMRDPGGMVSGIHGLLLVAQIAVAWGCAPTSDGGKVVWATLRTH